MKTLGILGGIGPESTGRFYLELVAKFQRAFAPKSNAEYPHIIVNSISAPDLIDVEGGVSTLTAYREGLRQLEAWGAELIVIACNSAYCFIGELRQGTRVPIVDARMVTERTVRRSGAERILVLASPTTIRNGLYRFAFATEKMLGNEEIARVGAAIHDYNLGLRNTAEQKQVADLACEAVRDGNVVIGGCTEIHAILANAGVAHVDPMQEAMEDILEWWRASTLEKRPSDIDGTGVFANVPVSAGTIARNIPTESSSAIPVARWAHIKGRWYSDDEVLNWVNHSCDPNMEIVSIDERLALRALRDISAGEEIVCDYDRTETGGRPTACRCGSSRCRGTFNRIDPT